MNPYRSNLHVITHYAITGDAGEVCSEEVLESHNVTKSFVPKLSPSKFDTKGDQDRPDKQHPDKVCSGNLLADCMHYSSTTQHGIIILFTNQLYQ